MNTKTFFLVLSLITLILASCKGGVKSEVKPNILVILADDLGYADLSFLPYAAEDISTPNIDAIAKKGVFFDNAYATAPICSPSRAGLITGRYQQRWGNYWFGEGGLPAVEKTLPQMLKKLGYHNVKIGKTHMNGGPVEHPMDHGFDDFLGFIDHTWDYMRLSEEDVDTYGEKNAKLAHIGPLLDGREKRSYKDAFTTDIFTKKTIEVIENNKDTPWYIELEYNAVHHPTYITHPDYLEKYGIEQFPFWNPDVESYSDWHKKWGDLGAVDPDGRKRYLSQLNVMDDGIGRILESLKKNKVDENTIIIFLSDNGGTINTYARNRPLRGFKYMLGEGGIRIPMIISYPKEIEAGKTVSQLVSAMDIVPTILNITGAVVPDNLDGKNLLPAIKDDKEIHPSICWSNGKQSWAIRKGGWKLTDNQIEWEHPTYVLENGVAKSTKETDNYPKGLQLYNLKDDIGEMHNLVDTHPKIVKELTKAYTKWRSEMSNPRTRDGVLKRKKKNKQKTK